MKGKLFRFLRKLFLGYSGDEWWDAFYFMSKKILPTMKQFRDNTKQGIPCKLILEMKEELIGRGYVFDENIHSFTDKVIDGKMAEDVLMDAWQSIIEEVCWALEYCVNDNDDDCYIPNPKYDPEQKECIIFDKSGVCHFNEKYGEKEIDVNKFIDKNKRRTKALELMGKYWECFWD